MKMKNIFLVVLIGTFLLATAKRIPKGKGCSTTKYCYCNWWTKWATCNSRKLQYIPRLPYYITKVKFVQNSFTSISNTFFRNLTMYNQITVLNLTDNLIQDISKDAFTDFRYLLSFGISKEPQLNITVLKESLYSLDKSSLLFLQFSGNEWQTLPMDMFTAFNNSRSRSFNISLAGNKIRRLDFKVFAGLKNLKALNLAYNSIKDVSLTRIFTIQELYLHGNLLHEIPTMCDINSKTLVPNLTYVRLDDNSIAEMDQSSFKCLEGLDKLRLDANSFRTLKTNTFSEIRNLRKLYISNNAKLHTIEEAALNISSLKIFYFKQNHFHFNKGIGYKYNPRTLFQYCPNLEVLDMTENYLPTVKQYSTFKEMFRPLTKLKNLTLSKTEMRGLPRDIFPHLKQLEYLNLENNLLIGWDQSDRIFGRHSTLKVLNLHSNNIRLVNKTTFPPALLQSLRILDLSDNFFSCTCDLMWFRDWIKENVESETKTYNLSLFGYPKYYKCKLPGEMRGLLLKQFNPTVENCKEKDPLQIIAISTASFGAFAIIVILASYKCQTNIRNYIYLCRFYKNKKAGYIRLDSDQDYEYHAFIVYCDADREWVHHVCVKKLEEEGLRVCIHHRDFDIGESVTGNIEKYMSKCNKIVVIMSNNFAESEWCQWEVDLVHERRRRQGEDVSVLVMLRSIDSKHMTSRLKALLDSTPHLTYCGGLGETIFWEALIKGLRKPFGHPPFAVV